MPSSSCAAIGSRHPTRTGERTADNGPPKGSYTLGLVPPSGINGITTTPATPLAVDVASGQEVTEALTVTGTN